MTHRRESEKQMLLVVCSGNVGGCLLHSVIMTVAADWDVANYIFHLCATAFMWRIVYS